MRFPLTFSILVTATFAWGQDVPSGPEKGKGVPALKVFDVTGPNMGKEVDYAAEQKEKPTVYIFVQAERWDRPMARFLRKLDEAVLKEGKGASIVAVWLTDGPDKTKEYLPLAQVSLKFETTALTCYTGDKSGPEGWGINLDAHLTAVVVNKKKVVANFGYRSLNELDAPAIQKALHEATAKK